MQEPALEWLQPVTRSKVAETITLPRVRPVSASQISALVKPRTKRNRARSTSRQRNSLSRSRFQSNPFFFKNDKTPSRCLAKSQTSSNSSRSPDGRMLQVLTPILATANPCWNTIRRRMTQIATRKSRISLIPVCHSYPHEEVQQEQPYQVQGPMPPKPLHPDPQGLFRRQGRQDQAELASQYVHALFFLRYFSPSRIHRVGCCWT